MLLVEQPVRSGCRIVSIPVGRGVRRLGGGLVRIVKRLGRAFAHGAQELGVLGDRHFVLADPVRLQIRMLPFLIDEGAGGNLDHLQGHQRLRGLQFLARETAQPGHQTQDAHGSDPDEPLPRRRLGDRNVLHLRKADEAAFAHVVPDIV